MGPYAAFVWSSFGIVAAVMILLALQSWLGRQRDIRQLRQLEELMGGGEKTPQADQGNGQEG
ncbi:heme exporter protein CcmD [Emcibacter nanhaiensis]|uniref:Heme exporter protein D n=1 Tax=Emcibacter nanhaiensis TaxID=1505037 RepID=A0A501PMQ5_9PROT|nr:heme exporter protein CcmD [Emcibacter nanhaiensis]TPD61575.1 heme exporter protein CcmD [Emcibacter nanhaiensis]